MEVNRIPNPFMADGATPLDPDAEAKVAALADDDAAEEEAAEEADKFAADVRSELHRMRARAKARELFDQMEHARSWRPPTEFGTLRDRLALPREGTRWRIEGLLPSGGNAILVASRKAGKTTAVGNLLRSHVDDVPFLGRFHVEPLRDNETVALFNLEMSGWQQEEWLEQSMIVDREDRVHLMHLRGQSLALASPHVRAWLVRWLRDRDVRVWIIDPYSRAYVGTVDNGNDEVQVGRFLAYLDEIKADAGVSELVMPVHAPAAARWDLDLLKGIGSQRLEAWPDALWYLGREGNSAARYFRAEGRDVDVPEGLLAYDLETRQLTMAEGAPSRADAARNGKADRLTEYLREHGPTSTAVIKNALGLSGSTFKMAVSAAGNRVTAEVGGAGKPTVYSLASNPFAPEVGQS